MEFVGKISVLLAVGRDAKNFYKNMLERRYYVRFY